MSIHLDLKNVFEKLNQTGMDLPLPSRRNCQIVGPRRLTVQSSIIFRTVLVQWRWLVGPQYTRRFRRFVFLSQSKRPSKELSGVPPRLAFGFQRDSSR